MTSKWNQQLVEVIVAHLSKKAPTVDQEVLRAAIQGRISRLRQAHRANTHAQVETEANRRQADRRQKRRERV